MVGTQVGPYRVLHQIGAGGMGSVWLAEHTMLGRRAAIKMLHAEFSMRPEIVQRFFNEARAATAISDPGIVQIFDFGHHIDGSAYIVMELLDGETLDQRLARTGPLAVGDALRVMRQVASSLGAAHARGIVHRDLKPENIFIVRDPEVGGGERTKVVDFGIAKLAGDQNVKTNTSAVMGTPTYMSPEQCRGAGQVDQRSDVYALGCVLFTLITGRPPFDAEGVGDIIAMHLREPPPWPSSRATGIPSEVDQLVSRCLAKDPAQRFPSANELAVAIGTLVGRPSIAPAHQMHNASYATTPTPTTLSAALGVATMPPGGRARSFALAGIAGVAIVGGIAVWAATRDDAPTQIAVAAPSAPVAPLSATVPAAPPPAPPAPAKPDPDAIVTKLMRDVLLRFVAWSHEHVGAPCPTATTLGITETDPWGQAIVLTCTDQPANQIIGAISAGSDGKLGTDDDIASWQLPHMGELVHGTHWIAAPTLATRTRPVVAKPTAAAPTKPAPKPTKPLVLDENGMPMQR